MEPIATTVAGLEPDTAANSAQAITPASARPPYQCPTIVVANVIMRRATPPWVRKLPARMKNGIAMISKLSMPVNSFSATASTGTWVSVNRNVSTLRPRAIDTGMPVTISANSSAKISEPRAAGPRSTIPYLPAKHRATSSTGTAIRSCEIARPACGAGPASWAALETVMSAPPQA